MPTRGHGLAHPAQWEPSSTCDRGHGRFLIYIGRVEPYPYDRRRTIVHSGDPGHDLLDEGPTLERRQQPTGLRSDQRLSRLITCQNIPGLRVVGVELNPRAGGFKITRAVAAAVPRTRRIQPVDHSLLVEAGRVHLAADPPAPPQYGLHPRRRSIARLRVGEGTNPIPQPHHQMGVERVLAARDPALLLDDHLSDDLPRQGLDLLLHIQRVRQTPPPALAASDLTYIVLPPGQQVINHPVGQGPSQRWNLDGVHVRLHEAGAGVKGNPGQVPGRGS